MFQIGRFDGIKFRLYLMIVVIIWRYLVFVTLQKTNCPMVQTNIAKTILYTSILLWLAQSQFQWVRSKLSPLWLNRTRVTLALVAALACPW